MTAEIEKQPISERELEGLKKKAKKLKKSIGCTHAIALDQVSQSLGYKNWSELRQEAVVGKHTDGPLGSNLDEDNDFTSEDEAFLRGEIAFKSSPIKGPRF
jgi:hypothetical protein